jgi:hypothetical protein
MDTDIHRPADDWELRCRFNSAHFVELADENEFDVLPADMRHPATTPGLPSGTLAQTWYYIDKRTRLQVAEVHCHYLPSGQLLPGHPPDPKMVRLRGIVYHQCGGPKRNRDRSLRWPYGSCERRSYVTFRKYICRELGPDADSIFGSWDRLLGWSIQASCRLRFSPFS